MLLEQPLVMGNSIGTVDHTVDGVETTDSLALILS